jgi:hypothetical protein
LLSFLLVNPVYNGVIDKYGKSHRRYMQISGLLKIYNWVTKLNLNEKLTAWLSPIPKPQGN